MRAKTIQIRELKKQLGEKWVLKGLELTLYKGEIAGLIGPNGSGKTTTLKILASIYRIDSGLIYFNEKPLNETDKCEIGYLPEERGLFQRETLYKQAKFFSELKGVGGDVFEQSFFELSNSLELNDKKNTKIGELSLGNQQRVQWLIALIHGPKLVLLDEPFNGLDPHSLRTVSNLMRERSSKGVTFLFSSHQLPYMSNLAERVLFLKDGRIEVEVDASGDGISTLSEMYEQIYYE